MEVNKVVLGKMEEKLKEYPDNFFDSMVTDAPYGLGKEPNIIQVMKDWVEKGVHEIESKSGGFMGKKWDSFVPQPIQFKEAFRVLKPGAHALVACGTRTQDWMTASLRFAGFEIRDVITWHYGSGFPKSLDISKAIDKQGGQSLSWFIDYILTIADEKGISRKQLTMLFPSKNGKSTGWLWNKQKTQGITIEQFKMEEINYVGIDTEPEYCEISEARIKAWYLQTDLFNE